MGLKRVLGHNFGGKGVLWGTILIVKRVLGHNFGAKKGLGAQFWGLKRALGHNFGSKKGLGAICYESSYAVTWGSLRMRSRPPPPM